ncbi:MAG: hypothetical protein NTW28_33285, partial [Candidatus Solibacter sp.]|nr:hypothetical protein [Candidatus Solibacter sp.]
MPDGFWASPFSATVVMPDTTGSVPLPDSDLSAALDAKGIVSIDFCQESEAAVCVLDSEASCVLVCRVGGASSGISIVDRQSGEDWQVYNPRTFQWGGSEVDRQIAIWLERVGLPGSTNLVLLAESLKIKVGTLEAVTSESGCVFGLEDLRDLSRSLVDRLVKETATVLEGCSRKPDTVLLSGGSAKLPALSEAIREVAGCRVVVQEDPQQTAARGAAILGRRRYERPQRQIIFSGDYVRTQFASAGQISDFPLNLEGVLRAHLDTGLSTSNASPEIRGHTFRKSHGGERFGQRLIGEAEGPIPGPQEGEPLGQFSLLKRLGSGFFAEVWLAKDATS